METFDYDSETGQVTAAGVPLGSLDNQNVKRIVREAAIGDMTKALVDASHPEIYFHNHHKCGSSDIAKGTGVDGVYVGVCQNCFEQVLVGRDGTVVDTRTGIRGYYTRKSIVD